MLLRNNGPANPKCNNISAVCKSVNAKKKYASATSLCLGEQDAKTKRKSPQSAAAPQPKAKEQDLKSAMCVCVSKRKLMAQNLH